MKTLSEDLLTRLTQADVVCKDCGQAYGKYSVGCSSSYEGRCEVCGKTKPVTEVRDWGYLAKGIAMARAQKNIKEQSKEVAQYLTSLSPVMTDAELEEELTPSYEQGEITLRLTEDEVGFLHESLDLIQEFHEGLAPAVTDFDAVRLFESVEKKLTDLYEDYCVKYSLSPALKAYYEKYGEYGTGEYELRWEGFRDAFEAANQAK
jgi:hypothetical protein